MFPVGHSPRQRHHVRFWRWNQMEDGRPVWIGYSKHAEVTVPSLDDWEKDWQENPQRGARLKLLPVDFRSPVIAVAESN
jgi:hypothetical protein